MTRDREATTLEQVLRACRGYVMDQWRRDRDDHHCPLVDSIDAQIANLSRAAEPVGYVWFADDGAVRMWWRDAKGINRPGVVPVFTHPSEDARSQCVWSEDCEGNWETSCGNTFVLNEGTPYDNEMGFCCYCGHKLEQVTQQSAAMAKENCNGSD